MKRIIASAGIVALGVASTQASTQGLAPAEQSKPWSVGLAVRGFYDDNYTTQVKSLKRDSYGVSVNPTAALNFNLEQTVIAFNYDYDLRWFEDRTSNKADHIQVASLKIDHSFSERVSASLSDRFIYSQEGSVYFSGGGGAVTTLQSDADYVRNLGRIGFKAGLTERVGVQLSYSNDFIDYDTDGFNSYSALLDRMEHTIGIEGVLTATPNTQVLLGYQFQDVLHRSGDMFGVTVNTPFGLATIPTDSEARDAQSHYIYAGLEHTFSPKLSGALRAGGQFVQYPNLDGTAFASQDDSAITPYVSAQLTYAYNPGSTLTLGLVNTYNQTDVGSALDQESLNVYLQLNHRITPKWSVGATAMFQNSAFNGGINDGDTENFYIAGVNTTFKFNANLAAEAGYNYDRVDSDINSRDFQRNRVFVGLRAGF